MDTSNSQPNSAYIAQPGIQPTASDKLRHSKALIPTLAVMAVAVAALATTLVVTRTNAQGGQPVATADVPAVTNVVTPVPQPVAMTPVPAPVRAPVVVQAPAPSVVQPRPVYQQPPVQVAQNVCHSCGVVESSVAVQRKGEVNGIGNSQIGVGTVAGGVLGAVLGNQIGHGNGRTAATVLGAAGGAYAGNAVQKNMTKVTVYEMRIRMNDGSYRTIEQSSPISNGSRVVVEGNTARVRG